MLDRSRIVFMGTPEFAVPIVHACVEVGEVVAVVTQPDRPRGRSGEPAPPPVKRWALEQGIPVLQPARLKGTSFAEELRGLRPDVAVVAAYGRILPPDVLVVPPKGCVNIHASLLPKYRGAAPIQWAIALGERETGVCLMLMEAGLDTGPVLACESMEVLPDDTGESLEARLAELGAKITIEQLPRYLAGRLTPRPQDHAKATLAPILKKEDGRVDFGRGAAEIERRLRAFTPWPGAYASLSGQMMKFHKAKVLPGKAEPGVVASASKEGIAVGTAEGLLLVTELQPEGRRRMSAAELLAGRPLKMGDRFDG